MEIKNAADLGAGAGTPGQGAGDANEQAANSAGDALTTVTTQGSGAGNAEKAFTQADIDRAVTRAIETREKNLREDFERKQAEDRRLAEEERLKSEGKYKDLYETRDREAKAFELRVKTAEALSEKGLGTLGQCLENLATPEGRVAAISVLATHVDAIVAQRVQDEVARRLQAGNTLPAVNPTANAAGSSKTVEDLEKMSQDEYMAHRSKQKAA